MSPVCIGCVSLDVSYDALDDLANRALKEHVNHALQLYNVLDVSDVAPETTLNRTLKEHVIYTLRHNMHQMCLVLCPMSTFDT